MDGGRRQGWINHRVYSQIMRRGPRGSWKNPSPWEKEFCKEVGTMEWGAFLQMRKISHFMSPNVLLWDDSAGKEAFDNAWRRFWCKKKGYVCDTPLPDPDLYIDTIDWDAQVDPELWSDLENLHVVIPTEEKGKDPISDSLVPNQQVIIPTGWGVPDYQEIIPTGWGDDDKEFEPMPIYYPHDLADEVVHGWNSPAWPNWVDAGPSHVPPYFGPTFVWQYPAPGDYWYYTNNYTGLPVMWSYDNVATSNVPAFESSYKTQKRRNRGGRRRPKKQSADK